MPNPQHVLAYRRRLTNLIRERLGDPSLTIEALMTDPQKRHLHRRLVEDVGEMVVGVMLGARHEGGQPFDLGPEFTDKTGTKRVLHVDNKMVTADDRRVMCGDGRKQDALSNAAKEGRVLLTFGFNPAAMLVDNAGRRKPVRSRVDYSQARNATLVPNGPFVQSHPANPNPLPI
jgi:hypothetical protein